MSQPVRDAGSSSVVLTWIPRPTDSEALFRHRHTALSKPMVSPDRTGEPYTVGNTEGAQEPTWVMYSVNRVSPIPYVGGDIPL